ncbi:MAG: histidine phosphatase family protein [Halobacteria archaeon]
MEGLLRRPEPSKTRYSDLSGSGRRLFLARHGVTEENLRGEIQGHRPGTLAREGRRWAEETGRRLRGEGVARIYASDLARALETARLMARAMGGTEVLPEPLLRERGYGDLEGRTKAQVKLDYPDFYSIDMAECGVEPLASVFERLEKFLAKIRNDGSSTLLVVAHGGTNSYLTNLLLREGRVMHPAHNEVSCFRLDGGGRVVEHIPAWDGRR